MALHKFEQNIKEKLKKRTLQPSINAWGKLDSKLEGIDTKKNNILFWILGIASCIIGILLVVPLFLNNAIENTIPIIVDAKTIEKNLIENPIVNNKKFIVEENLNDSNILNKSTLEKNIPKEQQVFKKSKQQFTNDKNRQTIEIAQLTKVDEILVKQEKLNTNRLVFKEQKMNDLLVETKNIQNLTVTDVEINKLLKNAQKELAINSLFKEKSNIVDANLLLQDVEADLDKSFRSKVFETLKINYKNMITAVSERNN